MPTDIAFRLSTYVTLALACATLGFAEWDLLPEASICSFVVGGLMILTFTQEGKLELSLTAANRLGLVIGIIAVVWIAFQIVRPSGGLIYTLPWPAGLLPYIGPLLMVLMPAKLFRPKHVGDWWTMHGLGLAAVALACTLSDTLGLGLFVVLYLLCGAWSLSLFYLRRAAGGLPLIPGRPATEPRSLVVTGDFSTAPKTLLGRAFAIRPVWCLVTAGVLGVLLFFATPRIEGPSWNLSSTREAGYAGDEAAPDLHRAGTLATANREIAFVVTARNGDGSAKTDLPAEQLWRGRSFSNYESGKWQPQTVLKWLVLNPARGGLPPDDAEPQTTLEFEWKAKKRDAVLATPLSWQPDRVAPVSSSTPYGRIVWSQSPDGFFYPVTKDSFGKYRQALGGVPEPNLSTLFELVRPQNDRIFDLDPYREFEILTRCDLPNVKDYARSLIARLVRVGKLPAGLTDRLDPVARTVPIDDQEAVARAFRDFIADSGEFTYDVKSPPTPKDVDPIDDFLTARKGGTCERFATALAQLLRAVGIPARIVIGFKGCEHDGNGRYLIRQENAHAWCEVLIRRPTPATYHSATEPRPPHLFGWLNLDPTPSDGEADGTAAGLVGQVQSVWQSLGDWFASFVSKYNPEQRERLWNSVSSWLARWWPSAVVLAGIVGVIVAIGRLVRRARMTKVVPVRPASSLPEWYERFLAWADRRGTPRRMVETPLEHARRIGNAPALRIAGWITALRYGGVAPNADDVESVLGELEQTPLATPSP